MKSSFTVQELCSRTGHELFLKCQEQFKYILRNVKLDKFGRTDILEMFLKTVLEQSKNEVLVQFKNQFS